MDTPEQTPPKTPTKRTRVRLASPRKQLERTIQKMEKLSDAAMKPEKLVDLTTTLAGLQVRLLDIDRDAKLDALIEENERLKSELARPIHNDTDDGSEILLEARNQRLKDLEGEVETLKSRTEKLEAEKTELSTTNNGLKSENSQLAGQVQSLQLTNSELQLAILELQTRTPQQLIDEANAKLNPTPLGTT